MKSILLGRECKVLVKSEKKITWRKWNQFSEVENAKLCKKDIWKTLNILKTVKNNRGELCSTILKTKIVTPISEFFLT